MLRLIFCRYTCHALFGVFVFLMAALPAKAGDSCLIRARLLMEAGEYRQAIVLLDNCLLTDSTNAAAYNLRGCATIFQAPVNDEKNNKTAILFFTRALHRDSTNYFYLNNRGWAWQNLDNLIRSYADFKAALRLDSSNVELHGNILRNLWLRNRNREAYNYCNKMIDQFPGDGYAWYVRGQLKRDYLHKYPEGNLDIKKSEELGWKQGFWLLY